MRGTQSDVSFEACLFVLFVLYKLSPYICIPCYLEFIFSVLLYFVIIIIFIFCLFLSKLVNHLPCISVFLKFKFLEPL